MQYMYSGGGAVDYQFKTPNAGHLITARWVAFDNGCFNKTFNAEKFEKWIRRYEEYKDRTLFVVMPDKVGDPIETRRLWDEYADRFSDWPRAFVAQDGQEHLPYPDGMKCLFVGGSTEWKMGPGARRCIEWAVDRGIHVHIGRVNSWRRYSYFAALPGGDGFTCDGTAQAFMGRNAAYGMYREHMEAHRRQLRFGLLDSDCGRKYHYHNSWA